uniref:Putative monocarboxylate transporter n=1 Tax=Ixodes ricinus TaxID=34613 RepID=A0A0K8R5Q1_IXORI
MLNAFPGSLALRSPAWISLHASPPPRAVASVVDGAATDQKNGHQPFSCLVESGQDNSKTENNQEPKKQPTKTRLRGTRAAKTLGRRRLRRLEHRDRNAEHSGQFKKHLPHLYFGWTLSLFPYLSLA